MVSSSRARLFSSLILASLASVACSAQTVTTDDALTDQTTEAVTTNPAGADLTPTGNIWLGGPVFGAPPAVKVVALGGTIELQDADAFYKVGGKCAYNIVYRLRNARPVAAQGFINRIRQDNDVVSQQVSQTIGANETKEIHTQAYLTPGSHVLTIKLDDTNVVAETNEDNNTAKVVVKVAGTCGAGTDLALYPALFLGKSQRQVIPASSTSADVPAKLTTADASSRTGGHCVFDARYYVQNLGPADALDFTDTIRAKGPGAADFTIVSTQAHLNLAKMGAMAMKTQVVLVPGRNILKVVVDENGNVADTNRANNTALFVVNVDSPCK